jgi:hypothetical protein
MLPPAEQNPYKEPTMMMIYGRDLGNSVGHDAHGWKLTDEGGEKGKARCAALAPQLLQLLCLTKIEQ